MNSLYSILTKDRNGNYSTGSVYNTYENARAYLDYLFSVHERNAKTFGYELKSNIEGDFSGFIVKHKSGDTVKFEIVQLTSVTYPSFNGNS